MSNMTFRSPIALRSRRALQSTTNTLQSPPGSLTKSKLPNPRSEVEERELRPEYHTISCELRALSKMVQKEIGICDGGNPGNEEYSLNPRSPLFERGRFYEEYSARRNERLKRKMGEEKKAVYGLGVRVESPKKRRVSSVLQSAKKTVYGSGPIIESAKKSGAPSVLQSTRKTMYGIDVKVESAKKSRVPSVHQSANKTTYGVNVRIESPKRKRVSSVLPSAKKTLYGVGSRVESPKKREAPSVLESASKTKYGLGVKVESSKKRGVPSVLQSATKTIPTTPMTVDREKPRYMLRSMTNKENKKLEKSVGGGKKKTAVRPWKF